MGADQGRSARPEIVAGAVTRQGWIFLFLGVVALHAGVFWLIKDDPVIPPQWLVPAAPEPTFKFDQTRYVDPVTKEKMVVKEFTIQAPHESKP